MFGWYHVYTPKFPQYNAALTDLPSDSQVFEVNTKKPAQTAAINAMPFGLDTWNTNQIFETGYRAGEYNDSGYHSLISTALNTWLIMDIMNTKSYITIMIIQLLPAIKWFVFSGIE